jgi:DNA-binding phage protein
MAIAVSAAGLRTVRLLEEDYYSEQLNKVTTLDPAMTDAEVAAMLQVYENLSNAAHISAAVGTTAKITGMSTVASAGPEGRISVYAVLSFERQSPLNAAVTLTKEFIIPAPLITLLDSNDETHTRLIAPDTGAGAGTPAKWLGDLVASLQDNLATYIKAADTIVVGGWTYNDSKSAIITAPRAFDGGLPG